MRTVETEELGGGGRGHSEGVNCRFKISPWNRNGGSSGALSPRRLLGQWHHTE